MLRFPAFFIRSSSTAVWDNPVRYLSLQTAMTRTSAKAKLDAIDRERPFKNELVDSFGRHHTYLRISVTERCNLRCTYCMPEEGVDLSPTDRLLTTSEIYRIAKLFVENGVTKIRLTGGEPTVRQDVVELVAMLNELKPLGLQSIAMTSNGWVLERRLSALKAAGLNALNLSLDTLDPFKFQLMTRRKGHERVLSCLKEALALQFDSLKLNCVVMRAVNDMEAPDFVRMTETLPLVVRFIEYMPFDGNRWNDQKMVSYKELRQRLETEFGPLQPIANDPNDTTKHFRVRQFQGSIGFISSMTDHFCSSCNRLRITADGNLKVCLFGQTEVSLRDRLRQGASDDELRAVVQAAVQRKKLKHAGMQVLAQTKNRPMILIDDVFMMKRKQSLFVDVQNQRTHPRRTLFVHQPQRRMSSFSHVDGQTGEAQMVDVSSKAQTERTATAEAEILMHASTFRLLHDLVYNTETTPTEQHRQLNKKGDILTVAKIAGTMAAKQTSNLIPLCHPLALSAIQVQLALNEERNSVQVQCTCKCVGPTGVEMEALTGASIAALTVYDMCKAVDMTMEISGVRLLEKKGGRRGHYLLDQKEQQKESTNKK